VKVKVSYTVDVTDEYRFAINNYYGRPGKANSKEVKQFLKIHGASINDDILDEYRKEVEPKNK
jgi:hypothetical protein